MKKIYAKNVLQIALFAHQKIPAVNAMMGIFIRIIVVRNVIQIAQNARIMINIALNVNQIIFCMKMIIYVMVALIIVSK